MSNIKFVYPAMFEHSAEMSSCAGMLQAVGSDVASQQSALSNSWLGDTGITYQGWQAQWNQALDDLVRSYQAMAQIHGTNTSNMMATDLAQAAKWGG